MTLSWRNGWQSIAGDTSSLLSVEKNEAYRLFTAGIFQSVSSLERQGQITSAQKLVARAHETLFSSSPNIASYSGQPNEQFRLLALAQATPLARGLAEPMIGDLAYTTAFELAQ